MKQLPYTYMRLQAGVLFRNFLVLTLAFVLLFFLGDLTENLDAWTGGSWLGHGLVFVASVMDVYAAVAPLLAALAAAFTWGRQAAQAELTAIEAAGFSPGSHWIASGVMIALIGLFQIWYGVAGAQAMAEWKQAGSEVGMPQYASRNTQAYQLHVQQDVLRIQHLDRGLLLQARTGGTTRASLLYRDHNDVWWNYDQAQNTLVVAEGPSQQGMSVPAQALALPRVRTLEFGLQLLLTVCLFVVAFTSIRRHGRSGGAALQVLRAVVLCSMVWLADAVLAYSLPREFVAPLAQTGMVVGILTISSLYRTIKFSPFRR